MRLYYLDTELNGNVESELKIWHCKDGVWHEQTGGTLTRDTSANWVQMTNVSDFSPFILSSNSPTAVKLTSFTARPAAFGIFLSWETATERDNAGFNLYRSTTLDDVGVQLNEKFIPSKSPGGDGGYSYAFLDATALPGLTYYYTLEDVDFSGRATPHGPVAIRLWRAYLPLVGR